jgi:signal transduction histidine kinase
VPHLLIVDDEAAQLQALCDTLSQEGFTTTGFGSAAQALASLRPGAVDVVLTDLVMPEMNGIAFLEAVRSVDPQIVGIVMTGHGAVDTAVKAMQAGALDYILKPFKLNVVLTVVNRALAIRQLRAANTELHQRVQQRTEELEIANRELADANNELESFSYSVSHDLRAPLRTINGFLDIYMTDHAASISPEGRNVLQHVVASAERMGQLIEDLLRLSRFSRQPLDVHEVPVGEIAARIVTDLRAQNPGREIEVRIDELPMCRGDASLIEQVFVNLLSNAFKFTRDRRPARIEVGGAQDPGEVVYFVRDNGAGFEPAYADKLFGVFQRLHSTAEFEGTGVGLSIVQRIMRRHGGRAWAESDVGNGATFFVGFPRRSG